MNKIITGLTLGVMLTSSTLAMEMVATDTMMKKDVMVGNMMATETKMMKDKMEHMMATGTKMKMDEMMMKKGEMKKCLDMKKATRAEIKAFQKENGIVQTGNMGKLTKAKLAKMNCAKEVMGEMSTTSMMMKDKMTDGGMMNGTDTKVKAY